jgi:hypothetical protein
VGKTRIEDLPRDFPKQPPYDKPGTQGLNEVLLALTTTLSRVLGNRDDLNSLVESVFHGGTLIIPGSKDLPFKALLDSGALHSSYMSKEFHHSNFNALKSFNMSTSGSVTLADNVTRVPIQDKVDIRVCMTDVTGRKYEFSDVFSVIDCAHDLILGLPTIVFHILPLFTESLYRIREKMQSITQISDFDFFFCPRETLESNTQVDPLFS